MRTLRLREVFLAHRNSLGWKREELKLKSFFCQERDRHKEGGVSLPSDTEPSRLAVLRLAFLIHSAITGPCITGRITSGVRKALISLGP